MVVDDETIYGFGRLNQYNHVGSHVGLGKMEYLLYAADRSDVDAATKAALQKRLPWSAKEPDVPSRWEGKIGLMARGMVLCQGVLFIAGPLEFSGSVVKSYVSEESEKTTVLRDTGLLRQRPSG